MKYCVVFKIMLLMNVLIIKSVWVSNVNCKTKFKKISLVTVLMHVCVCIKKFGQNCFNMMTGIASLMLVRLTVAFIFFNAIFQNFLSWALSILSSVNKYLCSRNYIIRRSLEMRELSKQHIIAKEGKVYEEKYKLSFVF